MHKRAIWTKPKRASSQFGFTLIELMVVVSITAVLIVISFPALQHTLSRSEALKVQTEMNRIAARAWEIKRHTGNWPQNLPPKVLGWKLEHEFTPVGVKLTATLDGQCWSRSAAGIYSEC